ncbi:hypothetical protein BN7_5819 [Wickerhamomyces ciferrii]|uniref:Uncharacterized protein n=1 Tax=Wickerhamomyces ciferrii (strain ATCC 14091 / BCRC 22168 / CBS 111 / JCM 3599 / NBRC 0793 / NRRL Y-1031 F-60-10) TaxID=1206466 RepID=K0KYS2_WICCF|nr:uncharacterized protein BN7_5819 [Wickerhamomyces ciferrii]CCH46228.1 hypothetical protein BN7_5819 [Wickerhamomyces ciferrii]
MSFSSILSQIKHKTKDSDSSISQGYNYKNSNDGKRTSTSSSSNTPKPKPRPIPTNSVRRSQSAEPPRTIDPAVQRLKELRRIENAKKEAANPKPKTQRRNNTSSSSTSSSRQPAVRRRRIPEVQVKESAIQQRPRSSSPQKRLSFKELMMQAEEKAKLLKERKEQSPNPTQITAPKHISKTQPRSTRPSPNPQSSTYSSIRRSTTPTNNIPRQRSAPPPQRPQAAPPKPKPRPKEFAKPSAQLQAKLDAKKRKEQTMKKQSKQNYYDEDEYESDFIEDDEEIEEEEEDVGYDRDEIWKMFNRGKSRSDFIDQDDDLSDMEATGSEVLNEEMRSAKRARLEEKEEAERERRRIEEKRRRLGK